jgi:hypothetical protein
MGRRGAAEGSSRRLARGRPWRTAGSVPGQGRGGEALEEGGKWSGGARTAPGKANREGESSAGEGRGVKHWAALMASSVAMPSSWSGIEGRQGLSEEGGVLQRGRACTLEWGGDSARQGSSGQRARAVQRRMEGGARVLCRARKEEESGRE